MQNEHFSPYLCPRGGRPDDYPCLPTTNHAQTPDSQRRHPRIAPLVLRSLLVGHHRMYAGQRTAPHRVLLQPQHLSAGRIRNAQERGHPLRNIEKPRFHRCRLRLYPLESSDDGTGGRARTRFPLPALLHPAPAGRRPPAMPRNTASHCSPPPWPRRAGRAWNKSTKPDDVPPPAIPAPCSGSRTGGRADCRNAGTSCSRNMPSTTSCTAAANSACGGSDSREAGGKKEE